MLKILLKDVTCTIFVMLLSVIFPIILYKNFTLTLLYTLYIIIQYSFLFINSNCEIGKRAKYILTISLQTFIGSIIILMLLGLINQFPFNLIHVVVILLFSSIISLIQLIVGINISTCLKKI